jgi:hypothetical protein
MAPLPKVQLHPPSRARRPGAAPRAGRARAAAAAAAADTAKRSLGRPPMGLAHWSPGSIPLPQLHARRPEPALQMDNVTPFTELRESLAQCIECTKGSAAEATGRAVRDWGPPAPAPAKQVSVPGRRRADGLARPPRPLSPQPKEISFTAWHALSSSQAPATRSRYTSGARGTPPACGAWGQREWGQGGGGASAAARSGSAGVVGVRRCGPAAFRQTALLAVGSVRAGRGVGARRPRHDVRRAYPPPPTPPHLSVTVFPMNGTAAADAHTRHTSSTSSRSHCGGRQGWQGLSASAAQTSGRAPRRRRRAKAGSGQHPGPWAAHLDPREQAHDGRDVDGEEAVPYKAHGLEEHDVPPQQDDVDRQHHRTKGHLRKHELRRRLIGWGEERERREKVAVTATPPAQPPAPGCRPRPVAECATRAPERPRASPRAPAELLGAHRKHV